MKPERRGQVVQRQENILESLRAYNFVHYMFFLGPGSSPHFPSLVNVTLPQCSPHSFNSWLHNEGKYVGWAAWKAEIIGNIRCLHHFISSLGRIKNFEADAAIIRAELPWIWIISHNSSENNSTIPLKTRWDTPVIDFIILLLI